MTEEEKRLMFKALREILDNQLNMMRKLEITDYDSDWGWNDSYGQEILRELDKHY